MSNLSTIPLSYWLILSSALFSIGLYGILTRKNIVGMLISIEILINSAILNFIAFDRYSLTPKIDGQIMGLLIMAISACEVVIIFSMLIAIFRHKHNVNISELTKLKG